MAVFVLIHGGGDVGWHWHRVEAELRSRGHDSVAPDLPCDDDSATLNDYASTVVEAVGDRRDLVVVPDAGEDEDEERREVAERTARRSCNPGWTGLSSG